LLLRIDLSLLLLALRAFFGIALRFHAIFLAYHLLALCLLRFKAARFSDTAKKIDE
jgi:hypothetical protein